MQLKKQNCERCEAEFLMLPQDYLACIKKKIFCPRCRCTPGRHRWTLIKHAVVCIDCFLLRIPLAVAVQRETLKRSRNKACKDYVIKRNF